VLGSAVVFIVGTVLFSASMVRSAVFPRIPAAGYGLTFTLLALLAPLPDTLLTRAGHVLVCVSVVWLSASLWSSAQRIAANPTASPGIHADAIHLADGVTGS
jgi:hypothetical protein